MPQPAQPPPGLLELIAQQQARVAALVRALHAAERAVHRADARSLTRAHRRANDALLDLEAAEADLDRLLQTHTAAIEATAGRTPVLPGPRRHRADDLAGQAAPSRRHQRPHRRSPVRHQQRPSP